MRAPVAQTQFRPVISRSDWALIANALVPYSHNSEYRDLLDRLGRQMSHLDHTPAANLEPRSLQLRRG